MLRPFQPDVFSVSGPKWVVVNEELAARITEVLRSLDSELRLMSPPEQSLGLEINSNNLRLTTTTNRLLLKRWSSTDVAALRRTLALMEWLASCGLPVPRPYALARGETLIEHDGERWTLFPFIEGTWFSGAAAQLESSAQASGRLTRALAELPPRLAPGPGPAHLGDADDEVLWEMDRERSRWDELLGAEHAAMLRDSWEELVKQWRRLRADVPDPGPVQTVHFDLHPHNLLVGPDGSVSAILDFEACQVMPIGYALAFAGVKQGRQTLVAGGGSSPADVGARFLRAICAAYPPLHDITRFADLAVAEVLRRLCIILRLNLREGLSTWNRVLPIQLAHLREARLLFT